MGVTPDAPVFSASPDDDDEGDAVAETDEEELAA